MRRPSSKWIYRNKRTTASTSPVLCHLSSTSNNEATKNSATGEQPPQPITGADLHPGLGGLQPGASSEKQWIYLRHAPYRKQPSATSRHWTSRLAPLKLESLSSPLFCCLLHLTHSQYLHVSWIPNGFSRSLIIKKKQSVIYFCVHTIIYLLHACTCVAFMLC